MEWDGKRLRRLVGAEVRVVVGELLDIVFNETVDVPFEHWAINVQPEFLDDVPVNLLGVRGTTHAFNIE
jgi:hypothetical protein